jgi:hypothetical protein
MQMILLPLLTYILHSGEPHLVCKKKENNEVLDETQRSSVGPKVDMIINNKPYDVDIALVEVSGPNWKVDKSHFLGDRNKLAKNLQSMYRDILKKHRNSSRRSSKFMKLYGLHIYRRFYP